ncbi:MAG TPA: sarcosine oxidase subunit delta [Reyranella sp.]|jgi:heterotetrameric sarcosine oxidase delta subunit|nr:sarcosine oxidase subunit delta [Reyranella sp.]
MLRIACPHCGTRDHTEFTYGGDATVKRPSADAPMASWHEAVYLRSNPRGVHGELWQHTQGCRAWIVVHRDTLTHEILETRLPHAARGNT